MTLALSQETAAAGPPHSVELGFEVADITAARAHLAARGVRGVREESMGWGEALELRDHDGHRVLVYSFGRPGQGGREPTERKEI